MSFHSVIRTLFLVHVICGGTIWDDMYGIYIVDLANIPASDFVVVHRPNGAPVRRLGFEPAPVQSENLRAQAIFSVFLWFQPLGHASDPPIDR